MKIAVLKENKNEYRVSLIPVDIKELIGKKHEVFVTHDAGINAGFNDAEYLTAGAKIVSSNKEAIDNSNLIFKLSELTSGELKHMTYKRVLIGHYNFANHPAFLFKLLKNKITSIGIEAFQENGVYTILIPNEQIKGRFGALLGAYSLSKVHKTGLGKTFTNLKHTKSKAQFIILNASYAGLEAARTILALGADVTILENDGDLSKQIEHDEQLDALAKLNHAKFHVIKADFMDLSKQVTDADVLINTNSTPGSLTSKRISDKMLTTMKPGSILIDLAVDQGIGADSTTLTSVDKPIITKNGIIRYAIENIPSLFAKSVSESVSHIITHQILKHIDEKELLLETIKKHHPLANAVLTHDGHVTNKIVGNALHIDSIKFE